MKSLCWVLALFVGLAAPGCKSVTYVPIGELTEDEARRLSSAEGLPVLGYLSDRGTLFASQAHAHRSAGGIRFTPDRKDEFFPGPVTVSRLRIQGVGRPRTDAGKSFAAIVLVPLGLFAALLTAGNAVEENVNLQTWKGEE